MCASAFNALQPMALAMCLTDRMSWEKQDCFEVTCPHRFVTYLVVRDREAEQESLAARCLACGKRRVAKCLMRNGPSRFMA
jgi:hypothetical protein